MTRCNASKGSVLGFLIQGFLSPHIQYRLLTKEYVYGILVGMLIYTDLQDNPCSRETVLQQMYECLVNEDFTSYIYLNNQFQKIESNYVLVERNLVDEILSSDKVDASFKSQLTASSVATDTSIQYLQGIKENRIIAEIVDALSDEDSSVSPESFKQIVEYHLLHEGGLTKEIIESFMCSEHLTFEDKKALAVRIDTLEAYASLTEYNGHKIMADAEEKKFFRQLFFKMKSKYGLHAATHSGMAHAFNSLIEYTLLYNPSSEDVDFFVNNFHYRNRYLNNFGLLLDVKNVTLDQILVYLTGLVEANRYDEYMYSRRQLIRFLEGKEIRNLDSEVYPLKDKKRNKNFKGYDTPVDEDLFRLIDDAKASTVWDIQEYLPNLIAQVSVHAPYYTILKHRLEEVEYLGRRGKLEKIDSYKKSDAELEWEKFFNRASEAKSSATLRRILATANEYRIMVDDFEHLKRQLQGVAV